MKSGKGTVVIMFKTELHAHCANVSRCGQVPADKLAEIYINAGYTTLVLTDHFSDATFPDWRTDGAEKMAREFLAGYNAVKQHADGRLNVLLGMEIRFCESDNDYLVFGLKKEHISAAERVFEWGIGKYSEFCRENGLVIIQAHPFRNNMRITDPEIIDGVEVVNGNPRAVSRNEIAHAWADKYPKLIRTSGSDYHEAVFTPGKGILTSNPITSNSELISVLKSGDYEIIE